MFSSSEITIKNIDHLGIVAGLIDEIGIVEAIDKKLGIDSREKLSAGTVVKAILLNGLGFVSRPLYLFHQFFEDKEVEKLLGTGVKSEYLNDDKLGRVMDELYNSGLNSLFIEIALSVKRRQGTLRYGGRRQEVTWEGSGLNPYQTLFLLKEEACTRGMR